MDNLNAVDVYSTNGCATGNGRKTSGNNYMQTFLKMSFTEHDKSVKGEAVKTLLSGILHAQLIPVNVVASYGE
jgi:hypothetical protein